VAAGAALVEPRMGIVLGEVIVEEHDIFAIE
jgi:hypothetical protein